MTDLSNFDLVSPVYDVEASAVSLAARVSDFNGGRLGLLDNRKHNVDHLLDGFEKSFRARYEIADVTRLTKFIFSMPASETDIANLAEHCDFVVAAIAD
jgi:hypothetical protein